MNLLADYTKTIRVKKHKMPLDKNLMGFIFFDGGGGDTESKSSLDPAQQEMLYAASSQITPMVRAGATATPYSGKLTVEPNKNVVEMINNYFKNPSLLEEGDMSNLNNLIEGKPAWSYDAKDWATKWKENYAAPMVNSWNQYVLPGLYETMNIVPGSLADTNVAKTLAGKSNEFYESYVAPTLYTSNLAMEQMAATSAENAKSNQLSALQLKSNIASGNLSTATSLNDWLTNYERTNQSNLYGEFQRTTKEQSPWLKMALGAGTTPTMDTVVEPGSGITNSLIQGGSMITAAAFLSDRREKENIEEIKDSISKIRKLKGFTYNYKNDTKKTAGIMAQDLVEVLPEGVEEINDKLFVKYETVIALLVNVVNEILDKMER